jgi:hypothetical protein
MKPPFCRYCDVLFAADETIDGRHGGLVGFADYSPLPDGMVGHPTGLEWFCARHKSVAERFAGKRADDAVEAMRRYYRWRPWLR